MELYIYGGMQPCQIQRNRYFAALADSQPGRNTLIRFSFDFVSVDLKNDRFVGERALA